MIIERNDEHHERTYYEWYFSYFFDMLAFCFNNFPYYWFITSLIIPFNLNIIPINFPYNFPYYLYVAEMLRQH